jgi:hypothetical protein
LLAVMVLAPAKATLVAFTLSVFDPRFMVAPLKVMLFELATTLEAP